MSTEVAKPLRDQPEASATRKSGADGTDEFGGDLDSTGVVRRCWRVGVAQVPVTKLSNQ